MNSTPEQVVTGGYRTSRLCHWDTELQMFIPSIYLLWSRVDSWYHSYFPYLTWLIGVQHSREFQPSYATHMCIYTVKSVIKSKYLKELCSLLIFLMQSLKRVIMSKKWIHHQLYLIFTDTCTVLKTKELPKKTWSSNCSV